MGKNLLLLITDGVEQEEYEMLRRGFECENAVILVTTPQRYPSVETAHRGRRGRDVLIDLPFEAIGEMSFDGLIIPDGVAATDTMRRDPRVLELIFGFYRDKLPIFASGVSVQLLYESQVLSHQVVVREGTPLTTFLDRAVEVLLDYPLVKKAQGLLYRPTI